MHRMPAFIDSHVHFLGIGASAGVLDLSQVSSIADMIRLGRGSSASAMIRGRGWNQERFVEKRMPTKADLNLISSEKPVVMVRTCGHVLVCNDKMLERAGITAATIYRGTGSMSFSTGIFTENAMSLIDDAYPAVTRAEIKECLVRADGIFLSHGITSVASDDFCVFPVPFETIVEAIRECYDENLIRVRITEQANLHDRETLERYIAGGYVNRSFGKLRMGPLKLFADGSLGGRTALLREDYGDDPGNRGIATYAEDELADLVTRADAVGMDSVIHAIGDAAADMALDAFETALLKNGRTDHRHALIHAQMTTRGQIARMQRMHIGAIVQPIFLNSDLGMLDARIGARKEESYLFGSMRRAGLHVGFSSDGPVETIDPFANLCSAVTRRSLSHPELGRFLPDEAFTVADALDCYMNVNRRYTYADASDDQVVTSADPRTVPAAALKDIRVLETVIGGKTVFRLPK